MSEFIRYSDDDIEQAKSIDILEVAKKLGFTPIQQGNFYTLKEHDSLKIYPQTNSYYRFSTSSGGNPINFVREFANLDFKSAIKFLIGEQNINLSQNKNQTVEKVVEERKINLPEFSKDLKRTYAYLLKTRKINKEVVNECVKYGIIKEDKKHNICFLGRDKFGNIKYCAFNGTMTEKRFKGEVEGSNKAFSFNINNNADKLLICESPIDVLSAMSILKLKQMDREFSFISVSGLTEISLNHFLEENKNVKSLVFMLDNDEKGIEGFKRLSKKFENKYKIENFSYIYKGYKDINEYLVAKEEENLKIKNLTDDLKDEIIKFCNVEYDENYLLEDFDKIYPDYEHIGIAYTTTPDEKYEIQYEIDLVNLKTTQYINNFPFETHNILEQFNNNREEALKDLILLIKNTDFNELIYIYEDDLKEKMNLEIDDEGNFFLSNEKEEIIYDNFEIEEDFEMEM